MAKPGGQDFSIEWVTPWTPSCNIAYLLDTVSFRIGLRVNDSKQSRPEDFVVSLWTDLYHKENTEGEWHSVSATYQGVQQCHKNVTIYMYGLDIILTCLGTYSFTYRAKHRFEASNAWAEDFEVNGRIKVRMPVKNKTPWILEHICNQITHNVYIGNVNGGVGAVEDNFDCLLNMADDVHIHPQQLTYPIIYKRCPLPFGVNNPIQPEVIKRVVQWLRYMSDTCKKVMVCSRTGHARSGSVLIAYIYFMNPDLSFEEAYAYVDRRSFVYPHKGLKDVVVALYPRNMCQTLSDCDQDNMNPAACDDGMCRCLLGFSMVDFQCAGSPSLMACVVMVILSAALATTTLL